MDLPEHFALGLNDGPPRVLGTREGFYSLFGDCTDIIYADDANDPSVQKFLDDWCEAHNKSLDFLGRGALMKDKEQVPCPC